MATLKQIRARIRAAKNIQQITKAMKLVSAARLKKATDRVLEARPYSEKLKEVMQSVSGSGDLPTHPLMVKRPIRKACVILLTSERGLAGPFNTSLIRKTADFIRSASYEATLYTVGKKGGQFFSRRGYSIANTLTVPTSGARLEDAVKVAQDTRAMFESGEVDAIFVCYAKFYSAIRQTPQIVQLLPIEPPAQEGGSSSGPSVEYEFEPSPEALLNTLLPRYFLTLLWQAMLESTASEFGARMTAMTLATDNAGKMIQKLTLTANRERQAAITKEILEVVGGAEALKS
jgi:F-type H+-transporting ATPase subunit gamma